MSADTAVPLPSAAAAAAESLRARALDAVRQPQSFTFHSPPLNTRGLTAPGSAHDVTDTSAASTPTHGGGGGTGLTYSTSHPLSATLLSTSGEGLRSAASSPGVGAASSNGYGPIRRSKDKQKHSESENRRRLRLRAKFSALREASQCGKKDRFNILQGAVDKLRDYEERLRRTEAALARIGGAASTTSHHSASSTNVVPPLSTPLSNFQFLNGLACCYISLDGRILDANAAFIRLFGFAPPDHSSASVAAAAATGAPAAAGGARADDLYSSSLFAVTHPGELLHTLSVLRNLLCGVMESYDSSKVCVTTSGAHIACNVTIASVHSGGKTVMFLVVVVPKQPQQQQAMTVGARTPLSTPTNTAVQAAAPVAGALHDPVVAASASMDDVPPAAAAAQHRVPAAATSPPKMALPAAGVLQPHQSCSPAMTALPFHPGRAAAAGLVLPRLAAAHGKPHLPSLPAPQPVQSPTTPAPVLGGIHPIPPPFPLQQPVHAPPAPTARIFTGQSSAAAPSAPSFALPDAADLGGRGTSVAPPTAAAGLMRASALRPAAAAMMDVASGTASRTSSPRRSPPTVHPSTSLSATTVSSDGSPAELAPVSVIADPQRISSTEQATVKAAATSMASDLSKVKPPLA